MLKITEREKYVAIIFSILVGLMAISYIFFYGFWIIIFEFPMGLIIVWLYYPIVTHRDLTRHPIDNQSILFIFFIYMVIQAIALISFKIFGFILVNCFVLIVALLLTSQNRKELPWVTTQKQHASTGLDQNVKIYYTPKNNEQASSKVTILGKERNKILKDMGWSEYYGYIYSDQILGEKFEDEFNKIKMDLQALKETGETLIAKTEKIKKIGEERNKILDELGWSEFYDDIHFNRGLETESDFDGRLGEKSEDEFNEIKLNLQALKEKKKSLPFRVIKSIEEFKPTKKWGNENNYHIELLGWLKREFPDIVKYEIQTGASRPDLVIKDIAIEIKGPTDVQALNTIASKLLRYEQYYPNMIIVLFECNFSEQLFKEIRIGINRHYQNVTIIRK